jgi:hypothetical protein
MWLMLPKPGRLWPKHTVNGQPYRESAERVLTLVGTIAHELLHCYGYDHGQFHESNYNTARIIQHFGGPAALVPVRAPKPPASERDLVRERYERILALEAQWLKKQQRATRALASLRRRRRGYEQRQAAKPSPSTSESG